MIWGKIFINPWYFYLKYRKTVQSNHICSKGRKKLGRVGNLFQLFDWTLTLTGEGGSVSSLTNTGSEGEEDLSWDLNCQRRVIICSFKSIKLIPYLRKTKQKTVLGNFHSMTFQMFYKNAKFLTKWTNKKMELILMIKDNHER